MVTTLKKINDFLAGLPMTIVAGAFLLLDLVPHLMEEFGGMQVHLRFLPFDPSWVTIIISGIPLLYLAIWRMIFNQGIAKISSALLNLYRHVCSARYRRIVCGGRSRLIMALGALLKMQPQTARKRV